jgi:hypothetical protein
MAIELVPNSEGSTTPKLQKPLLRYVITFMSVKVEDGLGRERGTI